MGLSIAYSGRIKNANQLEALVVDVVDFSKANNFTYEAGVFGQKFPNGTLSDYQEDEELYGVSFAPENCDPIFLTFVSNGRLCSPVQFMMGAKSDDDFFYTIPTKTQFAGVDAHIVVVDFLRYLSKKYFSEFDMMDEGMYWETQDRALLEETFARYTKALDIVAASFEMIPRKDGESLDEYTERIIKRSHDKYKDDE